jgi:hypothetical protein
MVVLEVVLVDIVVVVDMFLEREVVQVLDMVVMVMVLQQQQRDMWVLDRELVQVVDIWYRIRK